MYIKFVLCNHIWHLYHGMGREWKQIKVAQPPFPPHCVQTMEKWVWGAPKIDWIEGRISSFICNTMFSWFQHHRSKVSRLLLIKFEEGWALIIKFSLFSFKPAKNYTVWKLFDSRWSYFLRHYTTFSLFSFESYLFFPCSHCLENQAPQWPFWSTFYFRSLCSLMTLMSEVLAGGRHCSGGGGGGWSGDSSGGLTRWPPTSCWPWSSSFVSWGSAHWPGASGWWSCPGPRSGPSSVWACGCWGCQTWGCSSSLAVTCSGLKLWLMSWTWKKNGIKSILADLGEKDNHSILFVWKSVCRRKIGQPHLKDIVFCLKKCLSPKKCQVQHLMEHHKLLLLWWPKWQQQATNNKQNKMKK